MNRLMKGYHQAPGRVRNLYLIYAILFFKIPRAGNNLTDLPPTFSSITVEEPRLLRRSRPYGLPRIVTSNPQDLTGLLTSTSRNLLTVRPRHSGSSRAGQAHRNPGDVNVNRNRYNVFKRPHFIENRIDRYGNLLSATSRCVRVFYAGCLLLGKFTAYISPMAPQSVTTTGGICSKAEGGPQKGLCTRSYR